MKKMLVLLVIACISFTACTMEENRNIDRPLVKRRKIEKTDLAEQIASESTSFNWAALPPEIQQLILFHLASDKDGVSSLKTVKNLDLVNRATNMLARDSIIQKRAFTSFKNTDSWKVGRALFRAVEINNMLTVKRFFEEPEFDVDRSTDGQSRHPLMIAAFNQNFEMVYYLLAHGANVKHYDNEGNNALLYAGLAKPNNKEMLRLILQAGGLCICSENPYADSLFPAVILEEVDRIKRLLKKANMDVNVRDANDTTPLMFATCFGYFTVADLLVQARANVDLQDAQGRTALMFAASNGYPYIVDLLVSYSADLNISNGEHMTALHFAVSHGHLSIAQLLVAHNAHINAKNNQGFTPLMLAAGEGHKEIVELLIDNNAAIDEISESNTTALIWAVRGRNKEIVELLLKAGADSSIRESSTPTKSALDWARENNDIEIIALLESY